MSYILDTNIISELVAKQPHPNVTRWIDNMDPQSIYLSVITIGELKKGIEKLSDLHRKDLLEEWLAKDLLVRFQNYLLPIDTSTMLMWGALVARMEKKGKPLPAIDSLLAATTLQHDFTLVTRNTADFIHTGISLINPWDA